MTTIRIKIVKEFLKGKFYFRKNEETDILLPDNLPADVKLFIGRESMIPVLATLIDSGNGHKRINKIDLKAWFETEGLEVGNYFNVDIIDKATYRIYK